MRDLPGNQVRLIFERNFRVDIDGMVSGAHLNGVQKIHGADHGD